MKIHQRLMFSIITVSLLLVACSKDAPPPQNGTPDTGNIEPIQHDYPEPTREPQKFALLVGIDNYKYPDRVSSLAGCVNDVKDMENLLVSKFQFPQSNIRILTNERATHQGIIDAFKTHLIDQAQRDDIIVFHYSGHGSLMKDEENGDEPDGWDETIVPYDSRDPEGTTFDINDDQLNELLMGLSAKCKNVSYIFDSCHSGTISRGSGNSRYVEADLRTPPAQPASAATRGMPEGKNDLRPANVNYVLISACLAKQTAFEYLKSSGQEQGALTHFLTDAIRNSPEGVTYRDVMDKVRGSVQLYFPNQEPQIEGTTLDNFVFNDGASVAQSYILAQPVGSKGVRLDAGQLSGLTVGSTVAVFAPGTKNFDDLSTATATFKLKKVEGYYAEGERISGAKIAENSRAIVTEQNYPNLALRVYFKNAGSSPVLQQLKTKLANQSYLKALDSENGYHILLEEKDGNIHWISGDGSELSPPLPATAENLPKMETRMSQWAKWFNTLSIDNPASQNRIKLEILTGEEGNSRNVFANIDQSDADVRSGEIVTAKITNSSDKPLYIYLAVLSNDGTVNVVFPYERGSNERLEKGRDISVMLRAKVPEGKNASTDVYKVFATKTPVDFHMLASEAIKSVDEVPADPLSQLFGQAMQGVSRGDYRLVNQQDWETTKRIVKVGK